MLACKQGLQIHMIFLVMLAYSFVNFKNVHVNLNSLFVVREHVPSLLKMCLMNI